MKIRSKRLNVIAAIVSAAGTAGLMLGHAQETAGTQEASSKDSITAMAADSQFLPRIAPTAVPARGGTYWWVLPGGLALPTPCLPPDPNAEIYEIASQQYLVDQTFGQILVTPLQLKAEGQGTGDPVNAAVAAQVQGLIDLITWVQAPPSTPYTASTMALVAQPMDQTQQQSGVPYVTIAPTNGMFLLTVFNDQGPANYAIWWTPVLTGPDCVWQAIAAGTTGVTNFLEPVPQFSTGFYRAEWDTNSVPSWIAADPNNPAAGPLAVFIDSPANGAVLQ